MILLFLQMLTLRILLFNNYSKIRSISKNYILYFTINNIFSLSFALFLIIFLSFIESENDSFQNSSGNILDNFKNEFCASHYSKTIYEDDKIGRAHV